MTLLIDLGNSRLKMAVLRDDRVGPVTAIDHGDPDQLAATLTASLPALFGSADESSTHDVWLASVHHGIAAEILDRQLSKFSANVHRIASPIARNGLRIAYPDSARFGVDRWLGLLGVQDQHDGDFLLVSVGTALTIDLLDSDGRHHGGAIAPSPSRMLETLQASAPHLPRESFEVSPLDAGPIDSGPIDSRQNDYRPSDYRSTSASLFADNTGDAMRAGCIKAALGLIDRAMQEASVARGRLPALFLSGGGAERLFPALQKDHSARLIENAVICGLATLAREAGTTSGPVIRP